MSLTVLEAFVPGPSAADSGVGAGGTGEGVGVAGAGAVHAGETGFALTHVCAIPTQGPAEASRAQAAHHLQGAVESGNSADSADMSSSQRDRHTGMCECS